MRAGFSAFLVANDFLKGCETVDVRTARFGVHLDELSDFTWDFVERATELKGLKIKCSLVRPARIFGSAHGTKAQQMNRLTSTATQRTALTSATVQERTPKL